MLQTRELRRLTRFSPQVEEKIALEMAVSLPIPVLRDQACICRTFYFALSGLPPRKDFDLYPPSWYGEFSWETGKVLLLEPKEAAFFGLPGDRFKPFARVSYVEMNDKAVRAGLGTMKERQGAIDAMYDQLVPAWVAQQPAERGAADQFLRLFPSLAEEPFLPVYQRFGSDFFRWLRT